MTQQISQHPAAWIERLARFGYASKGVVYFIVGLLAVQTAFGRGGRTTNTDIGFDNAGTATVWSIFTCFGCHRFDELCNVAFCRSYQRSRK